MKIAIVGTHSVSRPRAPYRDPEWTIWACSPGNMGDVLPRVDARFELHIPVAHETRPDDYLDWLRKQPVVYMRDREAMASFPGAVPYPDEEMKARFGRFFFTSSIAYMAALAVSLGPEAIGFWGVHMASREEYASQRPGCQYFIQRAFDLGIDVTVPPESRLLDSPQDNW